MVCRALKLSRPKPRAPKAAVRIDRFPAVSGGISFWESARDLAIERGQTSLARMTNEIAKAHRSAWARFAAEDSSHCPTCGCESGQGRH
jgi:hypothetical protein